jgi:hypothetical protein
LMRNINPSSWLFGLPFYKKAKKFQKYSSVMIFSVKLPVDHAEWISG